MKNRIKHRNLEHLVNPVLIIFAEVGKLRVLCASVVN